MKKRRRRDKNAPAVGGVVTPRPRRRFITDLTAALTKDIHQPVKTVKGVNDG